MKQKFKKFGMLVAMLLAFLPALAYDFEVDGFYYEIVSLTDLTCKVVAGDNEYEGELVIPAEVTYNNRSLKVTEIGSEAFRKCKSLTSVTIPDSVTEIGDYAFSSCTSLTSVMIPDSVTEIGIRAFGYCTSLTSVTIGNSVTEIGDEAFSYCSSLTSVMIPDSVTKIGGEAFYECSSLTSVMIPDSVTEIGIRAFSECSSLTSATIGNSVTSVTIPDSVTKIGRSAFSYCSSLTSVTIGNSVTEIGYEAFSYCSSLTSVTIPDSVTEIGIRAFSECSSLTSATIGNSVKKIGGSAFSGCSALENITLGENLRQIKWGMFDGCKSLSSLSIPGRVYRIEQNTVNGNPNINTFRDCESLKEVLFLYGEYSLGAGTYDFREDTFKIEEWSSWTNKLEKVFLDRELEYDLPVPNLKELTIGEHMTKLQVVDIKECSQLESIVSYAMTPPTVPIWFFSNSQYLNIVVKVPTEALEAYQKDSVWGNFWNLQGFVISEVDDVEMDATKKTVVGCYDLNGRAVNEDYKGITIVRFSDGSTKKVVL